MRALLLLGGLVACAPPAGTPAVDETDGAVEVADSDIVPDVLPPCPTFDDPTAAGTVADDAVVEASGLVASRAFPGVWWVHNDSGDRARVFAVGADGAALGSIDVTGAAALDWEDIAIAPDGDGWTLLVGDIGDNFRIRPDIVLWRFAEPDPSTATATATATMIRLAYPDGPHDAETLLADPVTGDLLVVSKTAEGSHVYRAPAPVVSGSTMEDVGALPFGTEALPGSPLATGGEIAPDGSAILIRTYDAAFLWRRTPHATIALALQGEPCPVPIADEHGLGEAIAWDPDGGYATVAEGPHPTLWQSAPR